ncbi:MAG: hypothetical protein HY050_08740 [Actinobacteria bacterium]|nr:hypothetical protein [Actinomycetota bacterium]
MDHPDFLRSPDNVCKQDSRGWIAIEDQHSRVEKLQLHSGVPEDVRVQFETTKNIYLYAWFVYRFYPVAQHHAYTCLEFALRERFESELIADGKKKRKFGPGLKALLSYAVKKGYLKNEHFEVWRNQTRVRAWQRSLYEQMDEMERLGLEKMEFDETRIEIKDVDRDHEYLAILLKTIPWLRNHYAHGSKTLHNQVLITLQIVSEIINQIYPESSDSQKVSK